MGGLWRAGLGEGSVRGVLGAFGPGEVCDRDRGGAAEDAARLGDAVLTYGARSGEFATINGLGIDPDHEHLPLYEADRMRLVVTKSAFSDLSIEQSAQATEGDSATHDAEVAVSLSAPTRRTVNVDYATSDGTAGQPGDYTATSGRLTFAPGDEVKKIKVPVRADVLDEQLDVTLSEPSNASLDPSVADSTIRIVDQDPPRPPSATPSLSVDDVRVAEGNTGENPARLRLQLSESTDQAVTASYSTADVTAQAPTDYDAESGTVTFSPGERTAVVDVPVNGDKTDESDEAFDLNLPNVSSNATLGDSSGRVTIVDDDEIPPETTITSGPSGTVRSTTASVAFKSSEPEAGSFEVVATGAPGLPAPRRRAIPPWARALTPSRSVPSTARAPSILRRTSAAGPSTPRLPGSRP